MRSIIITLLLSVATFFCTLVVTNMYVSRRTFEAADYINDNALDGFENELNSDILLTKQSTLNFLSGIKDANVGKDGESIVFNEKDLPNFKSEILDHLMEFMKINRYYGFSMFIIHEDANRRYFGGRGCYAPSLAHGETVLRDIALSYDFMASPHFQKLIREKKPFWTLPTRMSPVAGKYMTLYIPLTLRSGEFLGAFAVSLDIRIIDDKLKRHLPYGEAGSGIFLVDENDNIFAAYPEWLFDYRDIDRKSFTYDGTKYYVFERDKLDAPWRIYTVCQSDAVYSEARKTCFIIIGTSLIGMLLMMLCCIVIFRQMRKNMRRKAAAEEELKMAANVQQSMLKPTTAFCPSAKAHCILPVGKSPLHFARRQKLTLHSYMRPAKEAGGDLYDYVNVNQSSLIFCIGDVSGKGMPAALFMSQVVSLFRSAVSTTSDPAAIVTLINNVLAHNNPDMTFCTFFVGVLHDGLLTFCNAGHNPPVLLSSSVPKFLNVRPNLALGLMEGFKYQAETIPFEAGTKLCCYTDGITEAKNKHHEQYGDDRLLEVLAGITGDATGSDITGAVLSSVNDFVSGAEQSDDITIVTIA